MPDLVVTVPFRDVDLHGHLHNATHLAYAEAAITAHLAARGMAQVIDPKGPVIFAVKAASVVFHAPTGFGDVLHLAVRILRMGTTSLGFQVDLTGAGGDLRARADVTWVALDAGHRRPVPLPDRLRQGLASDHSPG
ncbi:acyl-CoA thioesterase [Paracoccus sp. p3-h83]|uniref:acyl-CoA thioesterase n=1 Tax=Paracoccus sp. p3-h83 TaxID=3342805 RepID=UPI0035B7A69B